MAINKVIYGADTLVDLTEDTVTAEDVLNSKSFHTPDGVKRTGTAFYPVTDVQVNGTSVMDGTVAKVEQPTAEVKTATDQFNTVNGGLLQKCAVDLEPVQDLHGYDSPWAGGARKNKLPLVLADIKSANTGETWTGNNYTISGVTFTILTDSSDNVIGIKTNGTANAQIIFYLGNTPNSGNYILNGCPIGGSHEDGYSIYITGVYVYDIGSGINVSLSGTSYPVAILIRNGTDVSNKTFYPMLRLAIETDPTFEPYSNICPISGHTEVDLYNVGKNLFDNDISNIVEGSSQVTISDGTIINNSTTPFSAVRYQMTLKSGTYRASLDSITASGVCQFAKYDNETYTDLCRLASSNKSQSITLSEDITMRVGIYSRESTSITVENVLLEKGNVQTTYEPYKGHLYTVQIGSTVYGGYVDLVTGVMTATLAEADLGTLNWAYNNTNFLATNISGVAKSGKTCICSCYATVNNVYYATDIIADHSICMSILNTNRLFIHDSGYSDVTTFKTAVTGQKVVYELATPQTIQLTPQQIEALVGQNNLSTPLDGQSIETNGVEYKELFTFDDVEKVVSLRVPISMLGADESGRTTASQSYASGDYFYKDGYMCKALTSISAGATLTLNTNYSQGTLADILKAIENA